MRRRIVHAAVAVLVATSGASSCAADPPAGCGAEPARARSSVPSFAAAPDPQLAAGRVWDAIVHTSCGDVTLRLDGARAPRAVSSFLELARSGYWNGSVCDRLTARLAPTRLLQCGDPGGRGLAAPGYDLAPENVPPGHHYERGLVGMVTAGFDRTRAGEFFIVHADFTAAPDILTPPAVVGHVVDGMEVVEAIASAGVEDGQSDWHPFLNVWVRSVEVAPAGSS